jgi:hypothetical protein
MKKFLVGLMTVLFCLCLAACAPANIEKAQEKLKDAGYTIVTMSEEAVPGVDGSVGSITATKSDSLMGAISGDIDMIVAVLFESTSDAKEYYEAHKDDEKEDEAQIVKQDGKWVYVGTEDAIEDFTK